MDNKGSAVASTTTSSGNAAADVIAGVNGVMQEISTLLTTEESTREVIRDTAKLLQSSVAACSAAVSRCFFFPSGTSALSAVDMHKALRRSVLELVANDACKHIGVLRGHIQPGLFYKYNEIFRMHMSNLVQVIATVIWLDEAKLVTIPEIEAILGLPTRNIDGAAAVADTDSFGIDLETYLHGLCGIPSELVRYSVNCVIRGEYATPQKISAFLHDLYSGFQQLNLKNDSLRKRFDSMKYDLKRIEEIIYDLTIRGLVVAPPVQAPTTTPTPTPSQSAVQNQQQSTVTTTTPEANKS
ncbi:translin family protein [Pelomyxa schiedti]|nr:translin family protein [Pelomyxa schiedti]